LAETKLLPALFDLYRRDALPSRFTIVGLSRKTWDSVAYQRYVAEAIMVAQPHATVGRVTAFASLCRFSRGDFDDALSYEQLGTVISNVDKTAHACTNKLFYLAVPPALYSSIFTHLAQSGLMLTCAQEGSWSRLLVEKPFGRDVETAQALEAQLSLQFHNEQVYRIDHYLAKDTIENILALRFGNRVLADSFNGEQITKITIRMLESKDVSSRGAFYDGVGALRDVGQNHLLQILALLTMKIVNGSDVVALRAARAEVLRALEPPSTIVRGQYDGYRDTAGVAPDSTTETYFRLETALNLPQWAGVSVVLESGKALSESLLEARIEFRQSVALNGVVPPPNTLTITMAPEARISLGLSVKRPGFGFHLEHRNLDLLHTPATDDYSPEAYERVLYDCIVGDQSRFVSAEEVAAAWRFITPLLSSATPPTLYAVGSRGPK
jgi:glucose-6-phosphate 1-dehydrogenase